MNVAKTITEAAKVFGSQKALAEALGEKESSLSAFKKGRPISYQKHAQIAAVAGMQEEATRIILEGMAESLRDDVEHEAKAKAGLAAMLAAFPQTLLNRLRRRSDIWPEDRRKNRAAGPFFTPGHCTVN